MEQNLKSIIGLLIIILIVIFIIRKRKKAKQKTIKPKQKQSPATEEKKSPATEPVKNNEPLKVTVPESVDGKKIAYHYDDVSFTPSLGAFNAIKPTYPLTLSQHNDTIYILQENTLIGSMGETKISDMIRDWQKRGNPIRAFISSFKSDNSAATMAIYFYRDQRAANLRKYGGSKLYRLTGKPEEFSDGYQIGDICTVEEDFEKENKYQVIYEGSSLGYLPASAVNYAEKMGITPEDLKIIIGEVEYDEEKDRDIISVYIADNGE